MMLRVRSCRHGVVVWARLGLGTKDHVLIDLVNTHTNAQIAAIKKKWEAKVR